MEVLETFRNHWTLELIANSRKISAILTSFLLFPQDLAGSTARVCQVSERLCQDLVKKSTMPNTWETSFKKILIKLNFYGLGCVKLLSVIQYSKFADNLKNVTRIQNRNCRLLLDDELNWGWKKRIQVFHTKSVIILKCELRHLKFKVTLIYLFLNISGLVWKKNISGTGGGEIKNSLDGVLAYAVVGALQCHWVNCAHWDDVERSLHERGVNLVREIFHGHFPFTVSRN